jgi:regulator of protease activity HflC (stomatin/prohibitin superfamily)
VIRSTLRLSFTAVALAALLLLAGSLALVRVPPGFVGVRQSQWGGGVDPRDHGVGMQLGLRGVHAWHLLDARLQTLHFGAPGEPHRNGGPHPPIELRTRENSTARAEVAVHWRVRPGEAHELVNAGLERVYPVRVATAIEDLLRRELGKLSTESWFDAELLHQRANEILPLLDEALRPLHARADGLLLLSVTFSGELERKLQERQIAWQKERLRSVSLEAERARTEATLVAKETEMAEAEHRTEFERERQLAIAGKQLELATVQARAEAYEQESIARAEREREQRLSEARQALDRAKALGSRLRLEALLEPGGRAWIAREAARALRLDSVKLDPSRPGKLNPVDLDGLAGMLLGE